MKRVFATREGLVGGKTATGWRINNEVPFVALPSRAALRQWVKVRNPATCKEIRALVLDLGPWNEDDDAYVFGDARPASEVGVGKYRTPTNKAGIDLGEKVWHALGMVDNSDVEWSFT